MHNIQIDSEFQSLIPPLQAEELAQLEANILADGCRDPLVAWGNVLVDGHNRYSICSKHGLPFDVVQIEFADREAAMDWMDANQLGRRNITPDQFTLLLGRRYNRAKKAHGAEPGGRGNQHSVKDQIDPLPSTAEKLAAEHGVSPATVKRAGQYADAVAKVSQAVQTPIAAPRQAVIKAAALIEKAPEKAIEILTGAKSLADVKRDERREERSARAEELAQLGPAEVQRGPFGLVLADPPWAYDFAQSDSREIENQYPTATVDEIISHKPDAADDCVLLMWATVAKLSEALEVMDGWGFEYKTHAVWDKEKIGMGYWFRGQHELLLVGTKGKVSPPAPEHRVSSVFREARRAHSEKPDCVYEWIEAAFPHLLKLEMYCRRPREGWLVFGNEAVA